MRPLRISTQSSTKRTMMGSSEAKGVVRKRFDENISVNDCRAACVCPTETRPSACFRMVSGFVMGAIARVLSRCIRCEEKVRNHFVGAEHTTTKTAGQERKMGPGLL